MATPLRNADRVIGRNLSWHDLAEPTQAERDQVRPHAPDEEHAGVQIFGRLNPLAALPGLEALVADEPTRPRGQRGRGVRRRPGRRAGRAARGAGAPRAGSWTTCGRAWSPRLSPPSGSSSGWTPIPPAERLVAAPQISYFPREFDRGPEPADVTRVRRPGLPRPVEDREPLVYVTFGSEIPGMPMFAPAATAAVAAARQTGCRVLLSVGSADPGRLGDLTGVEVASWVDQATVLPRARAVISHAGAGTTLDALAAGTPTIAVPFFADQPRNAEQLDGHPHRPGRPARAAS